MQSRIDAARTRVENTIAGILNRNLSRAFALNEDWFDPYVGVRARYQFAPPWYLGAKADVGGFGVGSQITCDVYGAVGCQLSRKVFLEAGYRYLYTDYH